jgi:hypothetical protein
MLQLVSSVFLYFVQDWGYIQYFVMPVFILSTAQVYLTVFLIHFISAGVIIFASLASMVQLSLPYKRDRKAIVFYNFIHVLFKTFCGLNILSIKPVISNSY